MAYDRYDERDRMRPRRSPDDRAHGDYDQYREHGRGGGFFERAGEEISSWFGGSRRDEDDRGSWRSERDRERADFRGEGRHFSDGTDYPRDRERSDDRGWSGRVGRNPYARDEHADRFQHEQDRQGWFSASPRDDERSFGRSRDDVDYRPMAGDYGRSGTGQSRWDRDEYRRTSFAGSAARSNHQDAPYEQWRRRQVEDLDRDYDEYRRENQSRFEDDFGNWRQQRMTKRQMMGQVREHMDVVGSDGEHVGTVDRVAGDRIILTKSDPEAGGVHHSLSCSALDRVEDNKVMLSWTAAQAKQRWRDENRGRALFEREDQGSSGPHMLDRSFSGTYRD